MEILRARNFANVNTFEGHLPRAALKRSHTRQRGWLLGTLDGGALTFDARITPGCEGPALSPDGRWLAWGNWQASDAFVLDLRNDAPPHRFAVPGTATARFSPDSQILVLCEPARIQVIETGTWRVRHSLARPVSGELPARVAFTPDSRVCAVVLPPNEVQLLDVAAGHELVLLQPIAKHLLARPAFSPDSQFLAVTSTDHHLLIWNLAELRAKLGELGLNWSAGTPPAR